MNKYLILFGAVLAVMVMVTGAEEGGFLDNLCEKCEYCKTDPSCDGCAKCNDCTDRKAGCRFCKKNEDESGCKRRCNKGCRICAGKNGEGLESCKKKGFNV